VKDTRDIEMIIDGKGKFPIENQDANISQKRKEAIVPWSRPAIGWAKLNFDAGFSESEGTGAWGAGSPRRAWSNFIVGMGLDSVLPKCRDC
jgi:hypothetical protein